jgi:exodeoxyribonuclease V gamma subunit
LPLGTVGEIACEDLRPEVEIALGAVRPFVQGAPLPPLEVDLQLGELRVLGRLDRIWPTGQVHYGFAKLGRRSELGVWVRHLVLNRLTPAGYPRVTRITGRPPADGAGTVVTFDALDDAAEHLGTLAEIVLDAHRRLVPLFGHSSRTYCEGRRRGGRDPRARGLRWAREAFHHGHFAMPPERDDPYLRHAYAEADPVVRSDDPDAFEGVAEAVFGPMLARRGDAR